MCHNKVRACLAVTKFLRTCISLKEENQRTHTKPDMLGTLSCLKWSCGVVRIKVEKVLSRWSYSLQSVYMCVCVCACVCVGVGGILTQESECKMIRLTQEKNVECGGVGVQGCGCVGNWV